MSEHSDDSGDLNVSNNIEVEDYRGRAHGYPPPTSQPSVPMRSIPPPTSQYTSQYNTPYTNFETGSVASFRSDRSRAPPPTSNVTTAVTSDGREIHIVQVPTQVTEEESSDKYEFKPLNHDDVQINLRLIAKVGIEEKLHVSSDGKHIIVDSRYMQSLMRLISGDSRKKTLAFIQHVYDETKRLCNEAVDDINNGIEQKETTEKLIAIHSLIGMSEEGLNNLVVTYKDDKQFIATIQTIRDKCKVYCDKTLKSTIDGLESSY